MLLLQPTLTVPNHAGASLAPAFVPADRLVHAGTNVLCDVLVDHESGLLRRDAGDLSGALRPVWDGLARRGVDPAPYLPAGPAGPLDVAAALVALRLVDWPTARRRVHGPGRDAWLASAFVLAAARSMAAAGVRVARCPGPPGAFQARVHYPDHPGLALVVTLEASPWWPDRPPRPQPPAVAAADFQAVRRSAGGVGQEEVPVACWPDGFWRAAAAACGLSVHRLVARWSERWSVRTRPGRGLARLQGLLRAAEAAAQVAGGRQSCRAA